MRPVAIDVAILLPPATRDRIAELNAACAAPAAGGFRFDAPRHPHITLGQHFVDADALDDVRAALAPTFETELPLGRSTGSSPISPLASVPHPRPRIVEIHRQRHRALSTRPLLHLSGPPVALDAIIRCVGFQVHLIHQGGCPCHEVRS